ncbi:MAG: HAD superfamily hydrolase (TIGR01509 family) [Paraglaciecola sp.]|jgi:HAD superfamily hydrolase (TIGR01509 family)
MKYKCIIFDCDGVLVDSETISCGVLVDMANEAGLKISHEFAIREFAGKHLDANFKYINDRVKSGFPTNAMQVYRKRTFKLFKENLQPISGIHALIERLSVAFCVASSGPVEKIVANLTTVGLIDKFEEKIFSAYTIEKWKPDPAVFLWAAETMGFSPEECVVIEDSPSGVQGAIAGGFDVWAYVAKGQENKFLDLDIPVFEDMNELDNLLKGN